MRQRKLGQREMFVPLAHSPRNAQADFGEALVVIGGVEQKAHYFCMDLPQSDDCFVIAFPGETTEAFLEGHIQAFAYFGAVPQTILHDNTKLAVAHWSPITPLSCRRRSHRLFGLSSLSAPYTNGVR